MSWVAAAVATVGLVGGIVSRSKANKEAKGALKNRPIYTPSEEVIKTLALAKSKYGGRAPGASQAERNIYQTAANTQANVNRASTDVAQAILASGNIQGQTNLAFNQLQQQELEDEQRRYQNLIAAEEAMASEQKEAWQWNQMGKYQDTAAVNAAIAQNRANSWKDVTQAGMSALGATSSMGNIWKKGDGGTSGTGKIVTANLSNPYSNMSGKSTTGLQSPNINYQPVSTPSYMQQGISSSFGGNQGLLNNNTNLFDMSNMGLYGGYKRG